MQSNFIEIALRHGYSPVSLLNIFRTPFPRNTSGWLLLSVFTLLFCLVILLSYRYETLICTIWYVMRDLLPFVQFKKQKKHPLRILSCRLCCSLFFIKLQAFRPGTLLKRDSITEPATVLKVALLNGCFSRFLNRTNGTKLRKALHMIILKWACKLTNFDNTMKSFL